MSNAKKRRRARRRLKAHTQHGESRHVKSMAYEQKLQRRSAEVAIMRSTRPSKAKDDDGEVARTAR